jgi:hypothetical protein
MFPDKASFDILPFLSTDNVQPPMALEDGFQQVSRRD